MRRYKLFLAIGFFLMIGATFCYAADNVVGLWKIIDDKTGKPTAYVYLYMYGGKLYGRMIATIDADTGKINDTTATQTFKTDKVAGNPPFCGLDFVYQLEDKGKEWVGFILDPKPGDEYACVIKKEGGKLIVRGQLKGLFSFLGRNQTWLTAMASELPADYVMPDPSTFMPKIPKKK